MMPHVARTWGRRGQTPVLKHRARHRQKVSVIGALSLSPQRRRVGLYLQTHLNTSIDQHRTRAFVSHLLRHLRGNVVIVWDNINSHRSKLIQQYVAKHRRLHVKFLPPYAPDLNPVEWLWRDGKCRDLANHGLTVLDELHQRVQRHGEQTRSNQPRLRGFIRSARLPLRL